MWTKAKTFSLLFLALLVSSCGAVLAFVYVIIPQQRRKGAEDLVKAATNKAEALKVAAGLLQGRTEQQVAEVEARAEVQKQQDPVDFANEFIQSQEKKP